MRGFGERRLLPKHVLTVGSALSSIVLGLELLGFLEFPGVYASAGIMLITFGVVIAVDYYNERGNGARIADVIAFGAIVSAVLLGLACMFSVSIEGWEKIMGFMFILLACVMTYSMFKEKKEKN